MTSGFVKSFHCKIQGKRVIKANSLFKFKGKTIITNKTKLYMYNPSNIIIVISPLSRFTGKINIYYCKCYFNKSNEIMAWYGHCRVTPRSLPWRRKYSDWTVLHHNRTKQGVLFSKILNCQNIVAEISCKLVSLCTMINLYTVWVGFYNSVARFTTISKHFWTFLARLDVVIFPWNFWSLSSKFFRQILAEALGIWLIAI